jgi:single-stranded-DNA-specific exonuclease
LFTPVPSHYRLKDDIEESVMLAEKDVEKNEIFGESLKGLKWVLAEPEERTVKTLSQKLGIPDLLSRILVLRGISTKEDAESFLDPKLKNLLPDPFLLKDMDKAVDRLVKAIKNKEKITVFGDYDVDGATSTALLKRFFRDLGLDVGIYIPNRILEGYGPNIEALKKLKDEGNTLVITVDCGISSFDPIKEAKEYGLEIIVVDHHLSTDSIPEAYAVVNPNRFDDDFEFKSLAAVGVAFLTIVAIRSKLREIGFFNKNQKEPDLINYLDLVALGTVCDVMTLTKVNRAFVTHGLKLISKRKNLGIATLANVSRLESTPQSYHLGFVLGPRINAGGRVGEGLLGANLLSTLDPMEAFDLATRLENLNNERRSVEALILEDALNKIEVEKLYEQPIIIVSGDDWHQGILGILASRIKEKYNRPAAVISFVDGIGKGSARSIVGIDLGTLLANAKQKGILMQGGGHAMAGGFTIKHEMLDKFFNYISSELGDVDEIFVKAKENDVDSIITVSGINGDLCRDLARAAPFGNGNHQPKFALVDVNIVNIHVVGKIHFMIIVADKKADPKMKNTLKCMLFKATETDIGSKVAKMKGKKATLIGFVQPNIYDANKADFIIDDICV